jgi:hypothetical protein
MATHARKSAQSRKTSSKPATVDNERPIPDRVTDALAWLEQRGSRRVVDDVSTRYGIHTTKAYGVGVGARSSSNGPASRCSHASLVMTKPPATPRRRLQRAPSGRKRCAS